MWKNLIVVYISFIMIINRFWKILYLKKFNKVILFVFITLIFSAIFFIFIRLENHIPCCDLKTNLPIYIIGNAGFEAYKSQGNGTAEDPYIIEDLTIHAGNLDISGIWIENTNA